METPANKPLLVLNASAGSGKTYNLVRNYLVLLLKEASNKADLGQIIAMTFTNKAAYEMKTRIIRDLNKLANPTEKDSTYVNEIAGLVAQTPADLGRNARLVLKKMLHRYEEFNVLTIDKFNLKLIRSFSRDLNLPEQFDVVLDEFSILEKAVDELLSKIDRETENRIYKLAINFAKNNLDEETKWNVKKALIESSRILTDERSFEVIKNLVKKEFTEEDLALWKLQFKEYKKEIAEWQRTLQLAVESNDRDKSAFAAGSFTIGKLDKIIGEQGGIYDQLKTFDFRSTKIIENLEKTISAKGNPEPSGTALRFFEFWDRILPDYFELELKIKQFYLLSILRELAIYMEDIREKDAIIRISEFNKLVAELVKDEEAPFIYERLGSRFRHFFLDEFQDTSRLQWQNLVPLVHESLASEQFNLIVGDPKQSIYRFKNGVAEQFVDLPKIYNPENDPATALKSAYFDEMGSVQGLTENWRSCQEIVRFNNAFFTAFRNSLPESGQLHYNQIEQLPRGREKGYIAFEFFEKEEDTQENVLSQLSEWVAETILEGYEPGDICILSKRKAECNLYANYLKLKGYQVVSSDSLLVDSDQYVQFVIAFCRWRNNPNHLQLAMRFAELYFRLFTLDGGFGEYQSCFELTPEGKMRFSTQLFHEKAAFDKTILSSGFQDIFSLVQHLIRVFDIDELKNAYVHQLLDIAAQFDLNSGPDLMGFLTFYEKTGKNTNVQLPENRNSIKLMTAHKSKGLEFPVVIIPSVKFDSQSASGNFTLVESAGHFIQTRLSEADKNLRGLENLIVKEKEATEMDSVNLLYVAFTRPVDRLYFMGINSSHGGKLQKEIHKTLAGLYPEFTEGNTLKGTIGEKPERVQEQEAADLSFVPRSLNNYLWFPDISIMSEQEKDENDLHRQQRLGKQFHAIMEQSFTLEDSLEAIDKGMLKGFIETGFTDELKAYAGKLFSNELYNSVIRNGIQLDERTLLIDGTVKLRPDKIIVHPDKTIVVDFKTGERKPEHLKQVSDYTFALNMMQYPAIEGYLYYVNENEMVKVNTGLF